MSTTIASTTVFEPLEFQLQPEFPPDKEQTWEYPPCRSGWMHAHNSIRGQVEIMEVALDASMGQGLVFEEWELDCWQQAWKIHENHLRTHHENEDEIFVPFLSTRFEYPDQSEADHVAIVAKIDVLRRRIAGLKPGSWVEPIRKEFLEYKNMLLPHLQQEEDEALLLSMAYFTPDEIKPKVMEILENETPTDMGSFIYFMGVDCFRNEFMKQERIPFFVWYLVFKWQLRQFQRKFLAPIESLTMGK